MSYSTEQHVRRHARQRVVAVLIRMNQWVCRDPSPLLDCLALLWEYALPAVAAYDKSPGISLETTCTGRVLFGRLSPGRCLILDEKASSHDYSVTEVDLRHGTQHSRTIRNPLDGARVKEFCADPNSGRLILIGYYATRGGLYPERIGYTTRSISDGDSREPRNSGESSDESGDIVTMSAPLLDCQFDHSLCCCPSSEDGRPVAAYCISSPSHATGKRYVSRIHLEPPALFGRSEDLLEVKNSVHEMRVFLMSGEITVLLLARGDDRDKSPTIYTWKPGGPLLQKRVMESFHVSLNIGSPGCHPPPEALVLLDGDFPGRKLRALDLFEGSVIYEVDAPKGSEYSAWFFIDSSAAKTDRSRIDFGLLWGTAKVQNTSWQLLCWSPKYQ